MQINKNSLLFKWYTLSYGFDDYHVPQKTNLCSFVQRSLFITPFFLLLGLFVAILAIIVLVVITVGGPFAGYYPYTWKAWKYFDDTDLYMRRFPGLKLGESYNALVLYPYHAIILALLGVGQWALFHYHVMFILWLEAIIIGILAIVVGFYFFKETQSPTIKVAREYVRARKQGICPLVEFVDETKENSHE